MILDEISKKLADVDPNVHYANVPRSLRDEPWDYIAFSRRGMRRTASRTGWVDVFEVAIVREEFIPDGLPERVIAAMNSIPGMRCADQQFDYDYATKPESDDVVEMLTIEFVRPRRREADE